MPSHQNWPVNSAVDVPVSTTPPLNETDFNAMNFSQWKQLGRQVLIKSNINNWLICHPGTGSLIDWQTGDVSCHVAKRVTDTCRDTLGPKHIIATSAHCTYMDQCTQIRQESWVFTITSMVSLEITGLLTILVEHTTRIT